MSITIQAKNNYSFLFSSLGNSASNVAGSSFLSDYASIKNGSYYKLMKAYYNETGNHNTVTNDTVKKPISSNKVTVTEEEKANLTKVGTAADALKESADSMLENGSKSVFAQKDITTKDESGKETTTKGYDVDAIYKAVSGFVNNYNAVIDAVNKTGDDTTNRRTESMINNTMANVKMLNKMGITLNEDSTLSIDKDTFSKANMNTVKDMFNGSNSYGYRTSSQASMIDYAADRAASRSNTYSSNATYSNAYNVGNLFSMYL